MLCYVSKVGGVGGNTYIDSAFSLVQNDLNKTGVIGTEEQ